MNNEIFKVNITNTNDLSETWITLPKDKHNLSEILRDIGLTISAQSSEYSLNKIITSVECLKPITDKDIDIFLLADLSRRLSEYDTYDMEKLAAIMSTEGRFNTYTQVREYALNYEYYELQVGITTPLELGISRIYYSGEFDYTFNYYKDAIDPEKFGEYISTAEKGVFTEYGYLYIVRDKEWILSVLPLFEPKSLQGDVHINLIDTYEVFSCDLDLVLRRNSEAYERIFKEPIGGQQHICDFLLKGQSEELKKFIKDVQKEANISNYKISPFFKRIEEFEKRKQPHRKEISKPSVREQLKKHKEDITKNTPTTHIKKEMER